MSFSSCAFSRLAVLACVSLLGLSLNAGAAPVNLVTNGSFESTSSAGTSSQMGLNGFSVNNWSNTNSNNNGYNFLFTSGSATAAGQYNTIQLWDSSNGGLNKITASPDGGSFLAMDGAFQQGFVSQTLNNLTVGQNYLVSFYYAGAQQKGYDGDTTEALYVGFGSQYYKTPVLNDASHGFTGWQSYSNVFTATSASQTLSFLAAGTPDGEPPFSLLDGVSVVQVTPEPSSLALLGTGVLSVGGLLRRRFVKA